LLKHWLRKVQNQFKQPEQNSTISCNYNFVKILVTFGQTLFAIATLYRTRGDEIARYGCAAFGLTVTPYAFMPVVNLFGNLMCPEYLAMYLVEPEAMKDAENVFAPIQKAGGAGEVREREEVSRNAPLLVAAEDV
jgi:hypothetical protein